MNAYECLPIDEVTPVQYVGVYVMRWQPEWGEPQVAFRESKAAEELVEACLGVCDELMQSVEYSEDMWPEAVEAVRRAHRAVAQMRGEE